jgi:serine phosphatase RsbU (regulator of sigma subunit)
VPYLFTAAVVIVDLTTNRDTTFTPMLPVVPALAGLGRRTIRTVLAATVAAGLALLLLAPYNNIPRDALVAVAAALATVAAVSCASISLLRQQSQILATVRGIAETAQHVVLREIPEDLDQVRTASAYESAGAEARIGGDLYGGLTTPYGDRFIIGDVRGKGLPAVEAAADVLGVFREAAHTEPDLATITERLHNALARRPVRDEEFVTAVLLSIDPATADVEIVNCGHPSPLLLRAGRVAALAPDDPAPPLGMFDLTASRPEPYHARFLPGDTLLLYTDGTTEARDASGRFFPLSEYLAGADFGSPGELIALVQAGLRDHAGERLDDDVALVAVQRKAMEIPAATEPGGAVKFGEPGGAVYGLRDGS